ncbi:hypothetical protein DH2020_021354 [Rehmannia glutinosa]|uniref:RNase H type-1 domain-containing protein n=1 Tax=Rehmannia glutinosa TaxID=99300 RepID=A0ABR0WBV1_REHGL
MRKYYFRHKFTYGILYITCSQNFGVPQEVPSHGKYLGLPSVIGANKQQIFSGIIDRIWGKINGWKEKQLSQARRVVLIQSVLQSIPTFTMSCFKLPDVIIDKIHSMASQFLWGDDTAKKAIHWRSWNKLCLNKGLGGLGLRHLKAFNLALLCKQAWQILTCLSTLLSRIFKAKYFPRGDIFSAQLGHRPSWSWRSIFDSIKSLKLGCRKFIRSGSTTNIWEDPWVPLHSDFLIHSAHPTPSRLRIVADLIDHEAGCWKFPLVRSFFSDSEAKTILEMPLNTSNSHDLWGWHFSKNGKFLYARPTIPLFLQQNHPSFRTFTRQAALLLTHLGKKNAKLRIPPHLTQLFLWRCLTGSIATHDNLEIRNLDMCEILAVVCDFIWYARNKKKFENIDPDPLAIALAANNKLVDFNAAHSWPERSSLALSSSCLTKRSPIGPCIFFDGAISTSGSCAGTGVVVYDAAGKFVQGHSKKFPGISNAEVAELLALREALWVGRQLNLSLVEIFGDAAAIILAINGESHFPISCAAIYDEVLAAKAQVSLASISWIRRHNNSVAHFFASFAKNMSFDSYDWDHIPPPLCQSLLDDFLHL